MDVKAGATVGFTTAVGFLGGALFAGMIGMVTGKNSDKLTAISGAVGGLVGAFAGGTMVAATPTGPAAATAAPANSAIPTTTPAALNASTAPVAPAASMTTPPGSTTSRA